MLRSCRVQQQRHMNVCSCCMWERRQQQQQQRRQRRWLTTVMLMCAEVCGPSRIKQSRFVCASVRRYGREEIPFSVCAHAEHRIENKHERGRSVLKRARARACTLYCRLRVPLLTLFPPISSAPAPLCDTRSVFPNAATITSEHATLLCTYIHERIVAHCLCACVHARDISTYIYAHTHTHTFYWPRHPERMTVNPHLWIDQQQQQQQELYYSSHTREPHVPLRCENYLFTQDETTPCTQVKHHHITHT